MLKFIILVILSSGYRKKLFITLLNIAILDQDLLEHKELTVNIIA